MSAAASWKDICIDPNRLKWCRGDTVRVEQGGTRLGEGTYGTVYRGDYDGAPVAIKVLKAKEPNDRLSTKRTAAEDQHAREIRRLTELRFGHVVQCYGVSQCDQSNDLLLVTECLEGGSLHQNLERARQADVELSETSFLIIGLHVARGLRHIHNRYVHGDLKPHNVLVNAKIIIDRDKGVGYFPSLVQAKVADFGMSRRLNSDERRLAKSTVEFDDKAFGSWGYLAPELFSGAQGFDEDALKAVDVFAFGVLLYEMLSGMAPWAHEGVVNPVHLCHLVVSEKRRPHWGSRDIKEEYREVVERCWCEDSTRRPTAVELSDCFGRWLDEAHQRSGSIGPPCGIDAQHHGHDCLDDCRISTELPIPQQATGTSDSTVLVTGIETGGRELEVAPLVEGLEQSASQYDSRRNSLELTLSGIAVRRVESHLLNSLESLELELPVSSTVLAQNRDSPSEEGAFLCDSMLEAFRNYNNEHDAAGGSEVTQEATPSIAVSSNPLQEVVCPSKDDVLRVLRIPGDVARLRAWWRQGYAAVVASAMAQEQNMELISSRSGLVTELLQNLLVSQDLVRREDIAKVVRDLCTALGHAFRGGCRDQTAATSALPLTLSSFRLFRHDAYVCHASCYAIANVLTVCNEIPDDRIRAEVAECVSDAISTNLNLQRGGPLLAYATAAAARNFVWHNVANAEAFFARRRSGPLFHPSAAENLRASMMFFQKDPTVVEAMLSVFAALAHFPCNRVNLIKFGIVSGIARVLDRPEMVQNSAVLKKGLATLRETVISTSSMAVSDEIVQGFIEEGGVSCILKVVQSGIQSHDLCAMEESLSSVASISRCDPRLLNAIIQTGSVVYVIEAVFTFAQPRSKDPSAPLVGVLCDVVDAFSQHAAARSLMRQSRLSAPLETLAQSFLTDENLSRTALRTVAKIR